MTTHIAGAGLYGCVLAERLASQSHEPVIIYERKDHIGGSCYSGIDPETGIEYHKYGMHIFNTSDMRVWEYISQFTALNGYHHQVLSCVDGKLYQMPINLETINGFFGLNLKPFEVEAFLESERAKDKGSFDFANPKNFEEQAIVLVGRRLYEAFLRDYTAKQWGRDPKDLPAKIVKQLPFRHNYNENYYFTRFQGIPHEGYTKMFERMLDHPNITVHLNQDFLKVKDRVVAPGDTVIFTGPIDRYFDFKFGRLEYRGLRFEHEVLPYEDYQGTAVINFPGADVGFTRQYEYRHLHIDRDYPKDKTLIVREYPQAVGAEDDPYYPINDETNNALYARYQAEAEELSNVYFGGRLGQYRYINMETTIRNALDFYDQLRGAPRG